MKISIITVCKNSQKTLAYTLNSVGSQIYKNIEHIIVDGDSTDNTKKIIKNYQKNCKNKKIKYFSQSGSGIYNAINLGIKKSTGDFISILNSDDIYQSPQTISKIVNIIKNNKNYKIFFFSLVYFKRIFFNKITRIYLSNNFKRKYLEIGLMPPHPASIIARDIYKSYGVYEEKFSIASDFDFFLRVLKMHKENFFCSNKIIVRMRSGGISGKGIQSYIKILFETAKSFKKYNIKKNILVLLLKIPNKLQQFFFLNSHVFNSDYKKSKNIINENLYLDKIIIIKDLKKIIDKNFILSGLNLAFLGSYIKKEIKIYKNLFCWPDGLFASKIDTKLKKIPGRKILQNLKIPDSIKNIIVIGNCSEKSKSYLMKKFKKKIIINKLPYGNINLIKNYLKVKLTSQNLALITLPTPKQEMLAEILSKKFKSYKIICIGASLAMCSGEEKIIPNYLYNLGLEFLWRLRTDPIRRTIRIFSTFLSYIKGLTYNFLDNIKIEKI